MRKTKKDRLTAKGWKIGTAEEFLGLSPVEASLVELRIRLADSLKRRRQRDKLTQNEFARLVCSSQSRVAKMEAGDPSVSLDLLIRSLLVLGTTERELAKIISPPRSKST